MSAYQKTLPAIVILLTILISGCTTYKSCEEQQYYWEYCGILLSLEEENAKCYAKYAESMMKDEENPNIPKIDRFCYESFECAKYKFKYLNDPAAREKMLNCGTPEQNATAERVKPNNIFDNIK
jgi:hypothetical protein